MPAPAGSPGDTRLGVGQRSPDCQGRHGSHASRNSRKRCSAGLYNFPVFVRIQECPLAARASTSRKT